MPIGKLVFAQLMDFLPLIRSGVALRVTLRIIRRKPFHISINI